MYSGSAKPKRVALAARILLASRQELQSELGQMRQRRQMETTPPEHRNGNALIILKRSSLSLSFSLSLSLFLSFARRAVYGVENGEEAPLIPSTETVNFVNYEELMGEGAHSDKRCALSGNGLRMSTGRVRRTSLKTPTTEGS